MIPVKTTSTFLSAVRDPDYSLTCLGLSSVAGAEKYGSGLSSSLTASEGLYLFHTVQVNLDKDTVPREEGGGRSCMLVDHESIKQEEKFCTIPVALTVSALPKQTLYSMLPLKALAFCASVCSLPRYCPLPSRNGGPTGPFTMGCMYFT